MLPPDARRPGPRSLRVPEGEVVAGSTGSWPTRPGCRGVRPAAHLRGPADDQDGRRCARTPSSRGGAVTLRGRRPPRSRSTSSRTRRSRSTSSTRTTTCSSSTSRRGSSSTRRPGHWHGHARQRAARPAATTRRDRRASRGRASSIASTATRAACSSSPATTRPRPALMAQLKARRVAQDVPGARPGLGGGRGRADRGADRPRPEGPRSGWPSSRTAGRSITGYRVRERFAGWTLLELDLVTGRTHQIRVHLDRASATRSRATRCTGRGRRARARTASSGCSSTRGGWSSLARGRRS